MKKYYIGFTKTQLTRVPEKEGKSIEEEMRKALAEKTPIEAIAPMIYTEHKDGVRPEYDIRTDRQELALDATDKYAATQIAINDDLPAGIGSEESEAVENNA